MSSKFYILTFHIMSDLTRVRSVDFGGGGYLCSAVRAIGHWASHLGIRAVLSGLILKTCFRFLLSLFGTFAVFYSKLPFFAEFMRFGNDIFPFRMYAVYHWRVKSKILKVVTSKQ